MSANQIPSDAELKELDERIANFKRLQTNAIFHTATPQHGNKLRGVGITRKSKEESKKAKKLAKSQRIVNVRRSNKKRRATGSKQRK